MLGPAEIFVGLMTALIIGLGGALGYYAYRGYLRNRSKPVLAFSAGLLLVSFGSLVQGVHFVVGVPHNLAAHVLGSLTSALGLVAVAYSILKK